VLNACFASRKMYEMGHLANTEGNILLSQSEDESHGSSSGNEEDDLTEIGENETEEEKAFEDIQQTTLNVPTRRMRSESFCSPQSTITNEDGKLDHGHEELHHVDSQQPNNRVKTSILDLAGPHNLEKRLQRRNRRFKSADFQRNQTEPFLHFYNKTEKVATSSSALELPHKISECHDKQAKPKPLSEVYSFSIVGLKTYTLEPQPELDDG